LKGRAYAARAPVRLRNGRSGTRRSRATRVATRPRLLDRRLEAERDAPRTAVAADQRDVLVGDLRDGAGAELVALDERDGAVADAEAGPPDTVERNDALEAGEQRGGRGRQRGADGRRLGHGARARLVGRVGG